jgi:TrmH family RNA methyltransferase
MEKITSNSNARIKELNKLNKNSSYRKEKGVFIVEGIRMFSEIPKDRLIAAYISESFYEKSGQEYESLLDMEAEKLTIVSDGVYKNISQTKSPQGIMGVVREYSYTIEDMKADMPFYLILESIQDPGNLGTILRAGEAAGVTGLIIGGKSCDIYNPKVIRSTMGAIFRLPFVYTDNLPQIIADLKSNGVTIYGAHLKGTNIYKENLTAPGAFLIGNEGNGLSPEISETADKLVKIPMEGKVESLNAATSAALISYEVMRQRKFS